MRVGTLNFSRFKTTWYIVFDTRKCFFHLRETFREVVYTCSGTAVTFKSCNNCPFLSIHRGTWFFSRQPGWRYVFDWVVAWVWWCQCLCWPLSPGFNVVNWSWPLVKQENSTNYGSILSFSASARRLILTILSLQTFELFCVRVVVGTRSRMSSRFTDLVISRFNNITLMICQWCSTL